MEQLKIKLKDIDRIELIGGEKRKTAAKIFSELEGKPDYLINGGMYDMTKGITVCDTIVAGKLINGGNYTNKGFSFIGGAVIPETTETAVKSGVKHFLGGSPTLIWNDAIHIEEKGLGKYFCNSAKAIRIAIGITGNELIVAFPDVVKTLPQMAKIMLDAGCRYAINLDGGGSTRVMQNVDGKLQRLTANTENRANSTWIAVYMKKKNGSGETMKKKKICIDAGHGGTDPGCIGQNGTKEKDITLAIALKIKAALQRNNIDAIMTRETDIASGKLIIDERAKIANNANVDYVVSVHANADDDRNDKTGYGAETYAYSTTSKGYTLAKAVQKNLIAANDLYNRGVKIKKYDIIQKTKAPAILVECGFLNNTAEEALLITEKFQTITAEAIAKGIVETLEQTWVEPKPEYNLKIVDEAGKETLYQIEQENRNGTVWTPVRQLAEVLGYEVGYENGFVTATK